MGPFEVGAIAIVFGCLTGIVTKFIDAVAGGKHKTTAAELRASQDRARMLEAQLIDSHRQNEQLQKQLDWNTKMLETQDRLMKQLSDGSQSQRQTVSNS